MIIRAVLLSLAAFLLISCSHEPERAPAIGDAFIGPATLTLRKDIDTKSSGVGVVHHGDHVEIIGQRRLWYKVRTDKGVEGWTDDRQLLDSAQMARLRKLAEETAGLPSQGQATTYDVLNVHTEPNRNSPSFVQVQEKETFDVITHRIVPRAAKQPKRQLIKPKPKSTAMPKKPGSKKYVDATVPPPPAPNAPAPPVDWIALSKERNAQADADTPPEAQDDWTLIRTRSGQSGWHGLDGFGRALGQLGVSLLGEENLGTSGDGPHGLGSNAQAGFGVGVVGADAGLDIPFLDRRGVLR